MAVQPIRCQTIQSLDSDAEFTQMLRTDRSALLCFFDASNNNEAWKRMLPAVEKLAEKYTGTTFMMLDTTLVSAAAKQFNIQHTPTFVAIADGNEAARIEGCDEQQLQAMVGTYGRIRDSRGRRVHKFVSKLRERKFGAVKPQPQQQGKAAVARKKQEAALAKKAVGIAAASSGNRKGGALTDVWHIVMEKPRTAAEFDTALASTPDAVLVYTGDRTRSDAGIDAVLLCDYIGAKHCGATLLMVDSSVAKRYNMASVPAFVCIRDGKVGSVEIVNDTLLGDIKGRRLALQRRSTKLLGRQRAGMKNFRRFPRAIGRKAHQPCLRYERSEGSRNWFINKLHSVGGKVAEQLGKLRK